MATGYTYDVRDGKVSDFAEFAMNCARAFVAGITMRDDSPDTPIPDEFVPDNSYHTKALADAETRLAKLREMTTKDREAAFIVECSRVADQNEKFRVEQNETRNRYDNMLHWVRKWKPPTPDHKGLKDFMVDQLESSIKFDCEHDFRLKPPESVETWYGSQVASATRDIEYHKNAMAEETKRCKERSEWVKSLRESLK